MSKRFATKLLSGAVVSGIGVTLAFVSTQSAGLPAQHQTARLAPSVEWCSPGAAGPEGPACPSLPRSTASQDPAELPPLPTLTLPQTLTASSASDAIGAYIDAVLAYIRDVRQQLQAATAIDAPAAAQPPDAGAIRESVEKQVEAAQAAVPQTPGPLGLPDLSNPAQPVDAHELAEAIRQRVQEQLENAQVLAKTSAPSQRSISPSSTMPGCTSEQTSGPNSSSTAIRCFQQTQTGGAAISSVVTTSSSVSSSTTSSAGVP